MRATLSVKRQNVNNSDIVCMNWNLDCTVFKKKGMILLPIPNKLRIPELKNKGYNVLPPPAPPKQKNSSKKAVKKCKQTVPWNKSSSSSSYSDSIRKDTPSTSKFDTGFTRNRSDVGKKDDDRIATSRIASKFNSYGSNYQRDTTSARDTGSYSQSALPRIRTTLEKKDASHPPVSYRPVPRTGTSRSRDPSPVSQSEKSSSSSYNTNRLIPRPYTRSVSRERLETTSPVPTLSKYTGRSSVNRDELTPAKYPSKSETSNKYGSIRSTKEDKIPRISSLRSSKDEVPSTTTQKYITSRFLPKNTIEKSYTAYTRPSSVRTKETSRKNRELLNVLQAHNDHDKSRSVSRCSSVAREDSCSGDKSRSDETSRDSRKDSKIQEMETVTVITRGTSPTPSRQGSFLRKRSEVARITEKQIMRPKIRTNMVDEGIQSDRLDDSTKSSRFAGASRMTAGPWSSILDMKFSNQKGSKKHNDSNERNISKQSDSPKNISRTSSSKSIPQSTSKNDKSKDVTNKSSSPSPPKNKSSSSKSSSSVDKKQLPPAIPKSDSSGKPNSHSMNVQNKDFRKSVLNMNPDGKSKKIGRRSTSVSSADSDGGDVQTSEATDISENLNSCKSFHKSSSTSRLPQKISDISGGNRRSPISDASTASSSPASGSEEESRLRNESISKKTKSKGSSRTSACVSSADELSTDKSLKPPMGPRQGKETMKDAEAKSFLMRALAPVTNLFKQKHSESSDRVNMTDTSNENRNEHVFSQGDKDINADDNRNQRPYRIMCRVESGERAWWLEETPQDTEMQETSEPQDSANNASQRKPFKALRRVESGEKAWWLEESPQNSENTQESNKSEPKKPYKIMCRVDSGERAWWLEDSLQTPAASHSETSQRDGGSAHSSRQENKKIMLRHVESGEIPWWLDENAEVPEGIEVYPNYIRPDGTTEDGRVIYKIRKNDSGKTEWWLDSSESASNSKSKSENIMDAEYQERHKIRHIDSGERAWWISSSENIPDQCEKEEESITEHKPVYAIRHQDSGEKAWWLQDDNATSNDVFDETQIPLGDRASPEGLEMPKDDEVRTSPYDNVLKSDSKPKRPSNVFISKHTNIDEILGTGCQIWSPLIDRIFSYSEPSREECTEISPAQVKIHEGSHQRSYKKTSQEEDTGAFPKAFSSYGKLDDAALQLYKDGDYGSYLDLEASISEQQEEFEGFQSNKKNSIVLRTQLSVRVHTIIEKLLTSEGRELRRALFSLKQIFQEDKDLVHEFVQNDGLSCLIKVGSEADQNYQNYILRALGQVMLYVDGMNGVMEHNQTIQWLYSLISSKFRLVVKTALKLLLVFVEYTDSNCLLLIQAINTVDYSQGLLPWHNIMKLLRDFDSADTELLIYAMTLINKVLNGIPDQDTYYDQTDALEEQGIEPIIQRYMSKPGTDLDLLQQFQIYETVLRYEDGEEIGGAPMRHLDESIRKTLRNRKSVVGPSERRKSRRHSTGTAPLYSSFSKNNSLLQTNQEDDESSSSQSSGLNSQLNGSYKDSNKASDVGVTPALRRRRERAERQRSFMKEQQESAALLKNSSHNGIESHEMTNGNYTNGLQQRISNSNNILNRSGSRKDMTPLMNAVNKLDPEDINKQPWILYKSDDKNQSIENSENTNDNERNVLLQLKRENTVKDLTQKLANQNMLHSPSDENKVNRIGDMSGLISKAKEGLAKSKSKADLLKSSTSENIPKLEVKKSENELRWEELASNLNRTLNLCDMDFTDLMSEDEVDILAPATVANGIPPPPPPLLRENGPAPPPPPLAARGPPPVPNPPVFGISLQRNKPVETKIPIKKNKKTVKLFWKEVRDDPIAAVKLKGGSIWDELTPVSVDTQKLEHLFESRAKDLITKKQQEMNKNKEIIVLDPKRSNAINIGMTKLPPPRSIKTAILKMDATIMNREGIEKLLTMLPTEEERSKIQEAQAANPDLPLGSAEQFLLTLASISELPARLKLWAFKLDFEISEREIAEPLMDLKQGIEVLKVNKTFRGILSTLLSIGNFLNGNEVKGFQIEYLAKVPEVKDTVHKHSLLHHLCHIVMEKFPDATDLYSEIGAITRASKIDFDELTLNIQRLEEDCKASWDHLKLIAKHDGSTMMKVKMSDFLSDCAERIILLGIIHRRIINRFHKFLLWLGIPLHQISETKPNEFCRIVSEFALEYRTTRERVIQQLEKKANHRERNKTRGKMITDIGKFRTKEDRADAELRQLLGSDLSDVESLQGTLPWRRTKRDNNRSFTGQANGNLTDGDDEILESLVKTATRGPSRTAPRERKRTRHADRKSLKRSRTRENNPFGSRDSP